MIPRTPRALGAALALGLSACLLPPNPGGDQCDLTTGHPCEPGYVCVVGHCEEDCPAGTPCGDGGVCRNDRACVDAGTEFHCANGVDDNGNGRADCRDLDCKGVACGTDLCVAGQVCLADGGCGGAPVVCASPPSACFDPVGTCDPTTGGCEYTINTANSCGGSCALGSCQTDGTCVQSLLSGPLCPGGICSGGACVSFPYAPSNFLPAASADGGMAGPVVISCAATLDTSDGGHVWCAGQQFPTLQVIAQGGGAPSALLLSMASLTIADAGSLTITGTRPAIFAVWGDAVLRGSLVAASTASAVGPGSNPAGLCDVSGSAGTVASPVPSSGGGGGGGYGVAGRSGGAGAMGGAAGADGGVAMGVVTVVPLRGGCPGSAGGRATDAAGSGGAGGRGGGAVQISAARRLIVSGTISVSGAAGRGGAASPATLLSNGGGGGGSGGGLLLEGQEVVFEAAARLTANGGGGGSGSSSLGQGGASGSNGALTSASPAAGGPSVSGAGGGGGGGSSQAGATLGADETDSGGGGGGGVGRIRINFSSSCRQDAGVVSPAVSLSSACP